MDLPFKILALAPFQALPETGDYRDRRYQVSPASLDEILSNLRPSLYLPVSRDLCPEGGLTIEFTAMDGFRPQGLMAAQPYLKILSEGRKLVSEELASGTPETQIRSRLAGLRPALPPDLTRPPAGFRQPSGPSHQVDDILAMVDWPGGGPEPPASSPARATDWPALFDQTLTALLEQVFNHPDFRRLEASWRGLEIMLEQARRLDPSSFQISIAPVNRARLTEVLDTLSGELAADPPHLILIDLPISASPADMILLERITDMASTLLAPTVCWVPADFFQLADWSGLSRLPYLPHYLEQAGWAKWRRIKSLPRGDWTALACQRFVGRTAYGAQTGNASPFHEDSPLWIAPAWALGALAVQSQAAFGWPSRFTDRSACALAGPGESPGPLEMELSEDRFFQFIESGLMPLAGQSGAGSVFFPKETAVSGGSFALSLFMARLLGFLFRYRAGQPDRADPEDLPGQVREALAAFWRSDSRTGSLEAEITALESPDGSVSLHIRVRPPEAALPGADGVEFDFAW